MALRRALVVDDSRSARVALKRLLEEHDLDVAMAESAELALEFLQDEQVDVIFMDHTMPGMDGLEAVSAIKANPDTATIPVMMYTTREGEVYVGQARALGAVGVMPKNVQPHELFEMLKSLGLVKDRREAARDDEAVNLDAVAKHVGHTLPTESEAPTPGMSLESLVGRMLEDQHLTLRSDILRSQRTFAKQVAKEIVLEQARAEEDLADLADDEPLVAQPKWRSMAMVASVVGLVVLGFLATQFKSERDASLERLHALETNMQTENAGEFSGLESALDASLREVAQLRAAGLEALMWAVSRNNESNMAEFAYGTTLAEKTRVLLSHLQSLGFEGEVQLTSHLGQFCLTQVEGQPLSAADAATSVLECDHLGHSLEYSTRISERLSVPFSRLLRDFSEGPVRLQLVALDAGESEPLYDYPDVNSSAGNWNQIARRNNRVDIRLVPGTTAQANVAPASGQLTVSRAGLR